MEIYEIRKKAKEIIDKRRYLATEEHKKKWKNYIMKFLN